MAGVARPPCASFLRYGRYSSSAGTRLGAVGQPDPRRQAGAVGERDPHVVLACDAVGHLRRRPDAGIVSTLLSRHVDDVSVWGTRPVGSHTSRERGSADASPPPPRPHAPPPRPARARRPDGHRASHAGRPGRRLRRQQRLGQWRVVAGGQPTGTAVLLNYAGWMGKNTRGRRSRPSTPAAASSRRRSEARSRTVRSCPPSRPTCPPTTRPWATWRPSARRSPRASLQPLDWSQHPEHPNVDEKFRKGYPHGIPTDYGKAGIGYRADLVHGGHHRAGPTSGTCAEKYSGKIVFIDFDRDCIGSALKYKGFSVNTTDEGELNQALQALLEIKPHLQAIKGYNVGAGLAKGDYVIAMDWDYDVALAQQEQPEHQVGAARERERRPTWRASSRSRTRPSSASSRSSSTSSWSRSSTPTSSTPRAPPTCPSGRRRTSERRSPTIRR